MAAENEPKSLPDSLWELAELAMADLEKQEQAENSSVEMTDRYLCVYQNGHCVACWAGCVMRFSLGFSSKVTVHTGLSPSRLQDRVTRHKLYALDSLRGGLIQEAGRILGFDEAKLSALEGLEDETDRWAGVCWDYDADPQAWKKTMRRVIDRLKTMGI